MAESDTTFRYVLLGNSGSGKSSILQMYTDHTFQEKINMTVAVDHKHKIAQHNGFHAKLQIFDTSGQQRFRLLLGSYMRYVDTAFIFYDVTGIYIQLIPDPQSPDQVKQWVNEFKENTTQICDINLVANKIDLNNKRVISTEQGRALAQELGLFYYETTVTDLNTINIMFQEVAIKLINQYKKKKLYNLYDRANPFKAEVQEKNYLKENQELQQKIQYYQDIILIQKVISLFCIIFLIFCFIFTDFYEVMKQMVESFYQDYNNLFILFMIIFALVSVGFIVYALKTMKNDKMKIL